MKYIVTEHILFYYHSGASQYSEYGWEAGIAQDIPPLTTDHWVELKLIVREPFSLTYCSSLMLFLEFQTTTTTRIYDLLPALWMELTLYSFPQCILLLWIITTASCTNPSPWSGSLLFNSVLHVPFNSHQHTWRWRWLHLARNNEKTE